MAKRKNARTKATRKATTAARKPAVKRAAKASRAKGASASSRAAGRKKTAARATRKAGKASKAAPKKTLKAAKKAAPSRVAPKRAKAAKPVKAAASKTKAIKKTTKVSKAPVKAVKAVTAAAKVTTVKAAAPKAAKRTPSPTPVVAIATPAAPPAAVATNGSPAKAPTPRKNPKRESAGARERATTRHSEPSVDRPSVPSSLNVDRTASQARSGGQGMRDHIKDHHESGPALTAGDVDADWEQAYSSGDEAPGGDNPTPDQDRVDEIGHALGVEYQEGEELKGADKISDRDKHRWELDPASSEDYPDRDE
jgi:hypothetical protein